MNDVVIVDAARTPSGRRNGQLSGWHPAELAAEVLLALVQRSGIDPVLVDDVIMGCVSQVGAQSQNVARNAVLAAGFPETVPATTVDRQCGSSQQALHFAAQGVAAGAYDIAIAAGVEAMSMVPMGAAHGARKFGHVYPKAMRERYRDREYSGSRGLLPQGMAADRIADQWDLTRLDLDTFGVRSQARAYAARDAGRFDAELVPVAEKRLNLETGEIAETGVKVLADEGIRGTILDDLTRLKPAFGEAGKHTAGTSSQIADGAAAVLVMSAAKADELGVRPRARIISYAVVGVDPVSMLTGPIPATSKALDRAGIALDDVDLVEINEAFASVVLAWAAEHHADLDRVNVNGGAIALGHPLGASGAKLTATLLNELERRGGRYGLLTMCEGGGQANATVIERL